MKRLLLVAAAVAVVALWAGVAAAGDYHVGTTLLCYDCHTMHYSAQHDYAGTATGTNALNKYGAAGPYTKLLKNDTSALCLSCHDGQSFAPDVLGANVGGGVNATVRQAGALTTAAAPYDDYKGHTLSTTSVTAPGGAALATGLLCTSCHMPHGQAARYRNLQTAVSYSLGATAPAAGAVSVWINNATRTYEMGSIHFGKLTAGGNEMNDFCASCHGLFHDAVGATANTGGAGAGTFKRHPTSSAATIGNNNSNTQTLTAANRIKVALAAWTDSSALNYTGAKPLCVSCHKAHGNQNPFGLIYMNRTAGAASEEGTPSGSIRDLCGQCHGYGN